MDADTNLQAIEAAWDELDATLGLKTREPITKMMRIAGDYHYKYSRGSLAVEGGSPESIESVAHSAGMECANFGDDILIIKHGLPTCERSQRIYDAGVRARREGARLHVVGWPR